MTNGIHHITAIASRGQENVHFYSKILGLRLVKKTVNQDDTETYHLFFGDRLGHPGMDLTFFIFQPTMQGRRGTGLVTTISLAVPEKSLNFWLKRFEEFKIKHEGVSERFGSKRIVFYDADDQRLELVGVDEFIGDVDVWTKEISEEYAIRHFYSATLSVISRQMIEPILLSVFGYNPVSNEGQLHLYRLRDSDRASFLEISEEPSEIQGFNAAGTVHHIAFRAKNEEEQAEMRVRVLKLGLYPTDVIDRFYFKSVYFRTPGGILFEIATDGPGFTADEQEDSLGVKLALPPFLEAQRNEIESRLPKIVLE
jgi:glyoxalase family protein